MANKKQNGTYTYRVCRILFLSIAVLNVSCFQTTKKKTTYKSIRIKGVITNSAAQTVIENLKTPPETNLIIVDSSGGNELAALKIAEVIFEKKIDVLVDGECSSACAHLILPAAKNVYVKQDALISFHGNIFGWSVLFYEQDKQRFGELLPDGRKIYHFLSKTGVNTDFLFCVDQLHQPASTFTASSKHTPTQRTKYAFLAANVEHLREFGVSIKSYDPNKKATLSQSFPSPGGRYNWLGSDCENLDYTSWNKVKAIFDERKP